VTFARNLLATLRKRELEDVVTCISADLASNIGPSAEGEHVSGNLSPANHLGVPAASP